MKKFASGIAGDDMLPIKTSCAYMMKEGRTHAKI